jgi:TatA/E family protein of Tat protein translocase
VVHLDRSAFLFTIAKFLKFAFQQDYGEMYMFEGLFQPTHLLVIFGIALLVFGPKKLRNWAKASERAFAASSRR